MQMIGLSGWEDKRAEHLSQITIWLFEVYIKRRGCTQEWEMNKEGYNMTTGISRLSRSLSFERRDNDQER